MSKEEPELESEPESESELMLSYPVMAVQTTFYCTVLNMKIVGSRPI